MDSDDEWRGWGVPELANGQNVTTLDPADDEAHIAVSKVTSEDVLDVHARLLTSVVRQPPYPQGDDPPLPPAPGTTDLLAPPPAQSTVDFGNLPPGAVAEDGPQNSGWHRATVSWNPDRGVGETALDPAGEAEIAVWLAGDDEYGQPFDNYIPFPWPLPVEGTTQLVQPEYDYTWGSRPMQLGFTAAKESAESTYEIDNLHLICGRCPRFVGDSNPAVSPGEDWYDPKQEPMPGPHACP